MKPIGSLINVDNLAIAREEQQAQDRLNPLSVKLVDYVFAKFFICCRGTESLFADPKRLLAEKTQWQATFTRRQYTTIDHIRKALLQLEEYNYPNPPQLGLFLVWNKLSVEDKNLLPKEKAYVKAYEILRDDDPKDLSLEQILIIRHTIRDSGSHFLKNNPASKTQPVFYRNYDRVIEDFISGKLNSAERLENKTDENAELYKQQDIARDFSSLNCYEKAMPELKRILGVDPNDNWPTKHSRMQRNNSKVRQGAIGAS